MWRHRAGVALLHRAKVRANPMDKPSRTLRAVPALLVQLAALGFVTPGTSGCQSVSTWSWDTDAAALPAATQPRTGLRAQFFGTTTVLIRDDKTALMVDGFFSRPGLTELGRVEPNPRRIKKVLALVDASEVTYLLVAHSHHDHAMDAPIVAHATNATLVGSESTQNIASGSEYPVPFHLADPNERLEAGEFRIALIKTEHSPYRFDDASRRGGIDDAIRAWLDDKLTGTIAGPLTTPVPFTHYKVGPSYAFFFEHPQGKILVVPTANVPLNLGDIKADVVFLSIADADKLSNDGIRAYWRQAVKQTHAKLVIPVHWDRFWHSLDSPLQPLPSVVDNVGCAMDTFVFLNEGLRPIMLMPRFEVVDLRAATVGTLGSARQLNSAPVANPFTDGCRKGRE
jgi:L-ascorbate metabolism protein UlaG (beta-lactamase superfamily)